MHFLFFFWEKIIKVFDFKRSSPSAKLEIYPSYYSLSKFLIVIREKNSEIWLGRWEVVSLEEGAVSGRSSLPFSAGKKKTLFFPPFNWATYSTRCIKNISIELCFFYDAAFVSSEVAKFFNIFNLVSWKSNRCEVVLPKNNPSTSRILICRDVTMFHKMWFDKDEINY